MLKRTKYKVLEKKRGKLRNKHGTVVDVFTADISSILGNKLL
jgi:hypothetical protein